MHSWGFGEGEQKLSKRYQGEPCIKCGSTTRYKSSQRCVPCTPQRGSIVKPDSEAVKRRRAIEAHQERNKLEADPYDI